MGRDKTRREDATYYDSCLRCGKSLSDTHRKSGSRPRITRRGEGRGEEAEIARASLLVRIRVKIFRLAGRARSSLQISRDFADSVFGKDAHRPESNTDAGDADRRTGLAIFLLASWSLLIGGIVSLSIRRNPASWKGFHSRNGPYVNAVQVLARVPQPWKNIWSTG